MLDRIIVKKSECPCYKKQGGYDFQFVLANQVGGPDLDDSIITFVRINAVFVRFEPIKL